MLKEKWKMPITISQSPKVTSSKSLLQFKTQRYLTDCHIKKEKQQIFTFEKLEPEMFSISVWKTTEMINRVSK